VFTQVVVVVGGVVAVIALVGLAFLLGMRLKSPLVLRPLIALQKRVINPRQMASAGTTGAYAAIIRHQGRTSGRLYETPVGAEPTGDGFVIALVYGPKTNWVRNVLASGRATIVREGETCEVVRPEIVSIPSVADSFRPGDVRGFRVLGVKQALLVHRAERSA
jgi:deazaflavin-dependent oxidoreductase (nitroreductase family)